MTAFVPAHQAVKLRGSQLRGSAMKTDEVRAYWEQSAEAWIALSRAGYDRYRDIVNTPAFLEMLPNVRGLDGIDLGCDEGSNTVQLAKLGVKMTGVDLAPSFVAAACGLDEAQVHDVTFLTEMQRV